LLFSIVAGTNQEATATVISMEKENGVGE